MEPKNDAFIIADTSGLISLTVATDVNHDHALRAAKPLETKQSTILVPYEILVETVNVLGRQVGQGQATAIAAYLSTTPLFLVIDTSKHARQRALARFATQPQAVSFTNCLVMATADEYGTKTIFGFDTDHAKNGYTILAPETTT